MNVVEVKNISKTYKLYEKEQDILKEILFKTKNHRPKEALKNISFNVKKGEVYGVLGGNGSGKSTVLSIVNGTTYPTKGTVKVHGSISLLNVSAGIIPAYTGYENIYYKLGIMGIEKEVIDKKLESIIEFSEVRDYLDQPVKKYSSGMKAKLGFSIAIHAVPDILIVDEALAVGDSRFQAKCNDKIEELKKDGMTIIFVSHSASSINKICQRACWIQDGELVGEGRASKISNFYERYMKREITVEQAQEMIKKDQEENKQLLTMFRGFSQHEGHFANLSGVATFENVDHSYNENEKMELVLLSDKKKYKYQVFPYSCSDTKEYYDFKLFDNSFGNFRAIEGCKLNLELLVANEYQLLIRRERNNIMHEEKLLANIEKEFKFEEGNRSYEIVSKNGRAILIVKDKNGKIT